MRYGPMASDSFPRDAATISAALAARTRGLARTGVSLSLRWLGQRMRLVLLNPRGHSF